MHDLDEICVWVAKAAKRFKGVDLTLSVLHTSSSPMLRDPCLPFLTHDLQPSRQPILLSRLTPSERACSFTVADESLLVVAM